MLFKGSSSLSIESIQGCSGVTQSPVTVWTAEFVPGTLLCSGQASLWPSVWTSFPESANIDVRSSNLTCTWLCPSASGNTKVVLYGWWTETVLSQHEGLAFMRNVEQFLSCKAWVFPNESHQSLKLQGWARRLHWFYQTWFLLVSSSADAHVGQIWGICLPWHKPGGKGQVLCHPLAASVSGRWWAYTYALFAQQPEC